MNSNNNNLDMNKIMELLSKMDKKDLEQGLEKASKMLGKNNTEMLAQKLKDMGK